MAQTPQFKVYTKDREYVAAFKYREDAAAFVSIAGAGATIRYGHAKIVWTEGEDGDAGESYDAVALKIGERLRFG